MGTAASVVIDEFDGVYHAAVATTGLTATGTLGGSVTTTGWTDIGFVDSAGKIKLSFEGNEVQGRPLGMEGNLKKAVTAKKCTIEFMGMEEDIDLLALIFGGTVASNALTDGADGELNYKALSIITKNKIYWFKKVAPVYDFEKEVGDDDWSKATLKFETYVEEAATAGERQWKILERTAP